MTRSRNHSLFLFVSILAVTLALSACGSTASSPTPTAPAAPSQAPAQPTLVASGTPAATIDAASTPAPGTPAPATPTAQPPTAAAQNTPAQTASIPDTAQQPAVPTDTASQIPDPGILAWVPVVSGLNRLTDMAAPADGSGRFLVLEQAGTIRVAQNGSLLPTPFMDITDRVGSRGNEQGLLGIALHPQYTKNGYFYVNYTDKKGDTVIARYQADPADPNRADPNSEKVLLRVDQPYANHNGGVMAFGPDGYLYMGLGDGGSGGDPHGNGQSLQTLLGKILRIDVNNGDPYAIPADNPLAKGGGLPEIWAYGLRNPWRFSFDRLTGDLYIGDVGQDQWEEIDFLPAKSPGGANFGWNLREGKHPFRGTPPQNAQLVEPVVDYPHGEGCSVTGGFVYRGQALPEMRGVYLYADYCSGRVWALLRGANGQWQNQQLFQEKYNITSFAQDTSGELYILDQASGSVLRLSRK